MALALMAPGVASVARAQTGSAGGKIQYSAPSNPTVASNLNLLNPQQGAFKHVQEDLFKPFKIREPDHSDAFPPASKFAPPMMDKRTQEMLDRQRNWAFTSMDDLYPELSGSPMDGEPGGKNDRSVSVIERYMNNMDKKEQSTTNKVNLATWFAESLSGTNSAEKPLESMTVEGQMMKMMKEAMVPQNLNGDSDVIDFKHASFKPLSTEQIAEQKRRMEAFEQLLNPHAATPSANPMNAALAGQVGGTNLLGEAATPRHRGLVAPVGAVGAASRSFYAHAYDDPTALALGQTNNLLTPKPAAAPLVPPPLTSFDPLPKRKF